MKVMRIVTHDDIDNIPIDKAALVLDDNGWIGTNIGCPFHGAPALFPIDQARAIMYAWNTFSILNVRSPESVSSDVLEWLS